MVVEVREGRGLPQSPKVPVDVVVEVGERTREPTVTQRGCRCGVESRTTEIEIRF